jgi:hypothetical protein
MRKLLFIFVTLILILFSCIDKKGSAKTDSFKKMSKKEFLGIVEKITLDICKESVDLSVKKAIELVKISNTIQNNLELHNERKCDEFNYSFSHCCKTKVLRLLELQLTAGMSYYSKKYDLYLGAPISERDSYFEIEPQSGPSL